MKNHKTAWYTLRCGGLLNDHTDTDLLTGLLVKELLQSVHILAKFQARRLIVSHTSWARWLSCLRIRNSIEILCMTGWNCFSDGSSIWPLWISFCQKSNNANNTTVFQQFFNWVLHGNLLHSVHEHGEFWTPGRISDDKFTPNLPICLSLKVSWKFTSIWQSYV